LWAVRCSAALCALACVGSASGKDLLGVYQDALRFDTQIQQAQATYKAAREAAPEAWAALLPQPSGNCALSRQKQDESTVFPLPGSGGSVQPFSQNTREYINTHGYQLQLTETLFSWQNLATLAQAHKKVAQAEATFKAAQEDLVQRVATAYFNVLDAKDTLDANEASLDADTRQLEQTRKRYQVGLIPLTNVQQTQAAHDAAAAAVIAAKRNLASMQGLLREITERDYSILAKPGDAMPLKVPQPADPQRWVSASMNQNLALISSRLAADAARDQVRIAFGGHLPTIAITGTRTDTHENIDEQFSFGGTPGRLRYPEELTDGEIGIQVTVPIFSGGLVHAQVHQAQFEWIAAKDNLETVSRQTEYQARDAYNGVVSEVAQVAALKQGVESAETALKATEAGYKIGTQTELNVLEERQALVAAQTSYATARYGYILDTIQLQLAAGTLDEHTLAQINSWLTVRQTLSTSPVLEPLR
ncbi:MAG: TolC family outer membrane protein, partial [Steroidobacteraceae bacterium]